MKENLGPIRSTIIEFVEKLRDNENELLEIKERKKDIIEEYKERLDVKAIKAALQIAKIRSTVFDQAALETALDTLDIRLGGYLDDSIAEGEE